MDKINKIINIPGHKNDSFHFKNLYTSIPKPKLLKQLIDILNILSILKLQKFMKLFIPLSLK